eukprot:2455129-Rhodomonas_salina.1
MISFRTHGLLGFLLLTQANQVALHFPVTPARSSNLPRLGFWAEGKRLALRGGSACAVLVTAVDEERGSSCPVQVHSGLTIAELKGLLEPEFNIPAADQDILLGGKCLLDAQTLAESSITDNSLIAVRRKSSEQNHAQPVPQPSKFDVSALQNAMRLAGFSQTPGTPNLDSSVASAGPPLDPMDARAQAQIEEQIKHANVQENLRLALEHTPDKRSRDIGLSPRSQYAMASPERVSPCLRGLRAGVANSGIISALVQFVCCAIPGTDMGNARCDATLTEPRSSLSSTLALVWPKSIS